MDRKNNTPPGITRWFLHRITGEHNSFAELGDLDEEFCLVCEQSGVKDARRWYRRQALSSIPSLIVKRLAWNCIMSGNYCRVFLRNIARNKGCSFINIAGLGIGFAVSLCILLWILDELSYDSFHENGDNIYRLVEVSAGPAKTYEAPPPLAAAPFVEEAIPEIAGAARIQHMRNTILVHAGRKSFYESGGLYADEAFFDIFSFPFLHGDPRTALSDPYSIVLSEEAAFKYFGSYDPVGGAVTVENDLVFTVTGVMKNVPHNSHLSFDFVLPYRLLEARHPSFNKLGSRNYYKYVLLKDGSSYKEVSVKLAAFREKYTPYSRTETHLQPLGRIHLHSDADYGIMGHGSIRNVYIFMFIALFTLVIACINFANLSTARYGSRIAEVGMRRVIGASRSDIRRQFLGESALTAAAAAVFAIVIVLLCLPVYNNLSGKLIQSSWLFNPYVLAAIAGSVVLTGIIGGGYPAVFLSLFRPASALRGSMHPVLKGTSFRKYLVASQFFLAMLLITGAFVVRGQLDYMRQNVADTKHDNLLYVPVRGDVGRNFDALKSELLQRPEIKNVTYSTNSPLSGAFFVTGSADWDGRPEDAAVSLHGINVGRDFDRTLGLEIKQGRFFSGDFESSGQGFVINEAAAAAMGLESPVGARIAFFDREGIVTGVVRDFNFKPMHTKIEPLVLTNDPGMFNFILLRISRDNTAETLGFIEKTWQRFSPGYPVDYHFSDDLAGTLYGSEGRMSTLMNGFTALSILVACLGLFGLASYSAVQRTKEIGIRKALGASVPGIVMLMSREFITGVVLAGIAAWPVSWFVMDRWLQNFAYRIDISAGIFIASGLLLTGLAWAAVFARIVRTARTNPVDSLRYE